ncbi:hypothetical protein [Pseudonocardia sediminis]|uniref:hypothetical protein n=1 Tax=Pseudonocardia sediminis TaxID=1397368 RepID=UPI001F5EFAF9|nr:hypothetical protein [Pseudonocardia sediminis]
MAASPDPGAGSRDGRGPSRDPAARACDRGGRLELARGLLRRMETRSERPHEAPVPGEDGRLLPVPGPLAPLLPGGGLRRGSTVSVATGPGAGSLLFALLAAASQDGTWAGVIGRPGLGAVAAAEAGVRLDRLALVPEPGPDLVAVAAALLDGLDLVVMSGPERAGIRAADRQRLAARARQRGAVLLALGSWPGADVRLHCATVHWEGADAGAGRLRSRRVEVRAHGRGTGAAGRSAELLLPGPDGRVAVAPQRAGRGTVPSTRVVAAVAG